MNIIQNLLALDSLADCRAIHNLDHGGGIRDENSVSIGLEALKR